MPSCTPEQMASKPSLESFGSLLPAAAVPADTASLLWLRLCRLCRAEPYPRLTTLPSRRPVEFAAPLIANRRHSRSPTCATSQRFMESLHAILAHALGP